LSQLINVGSLCTDFVYAVPALVSAGETLASTNREVFAGGKGLNQSIAAAQAGCQVAHVGALGPDGDHLVAALSEHGVDTSGVERVDTPSGHAFIQVDPMGQNAIVIHGGSNRRLEPEQWREPIARAQRGDWLLLQNETNSIAQVIQDAAASEINIAINLAPADPSVRDLPLNSVDVLIVNEAEARMLADTEAEEEAFEALLKRYPDVTIVMTLGNKGLQYATPDGARGHQGVFNVEAVDETAAGDAFVGYFMAGLVGGEDLATALLAGSAAGALAVTRAGAAPSIPNAQEVARLMEEQPR
jgi:ribokinase